jgi:WD40 repeat protein
VCAMPRRAYLTGITFCGNGRFVATAHAKGLEVFDATTGAPVFKNFHYPQPRQLAVRGETVVATAADTYTALRPMLKATEDAVFAGTLKAIFFRSKLAFVSCAPDASRVLSADGNRFVLMDVASDRTVAEIECPAGDPSGERAVKFCPLGKRFVINDGRTLEVYDASGLTEEEAEDDQSADTPLVQRANGTQTAVAVAPMPHTLLAPVFALKPDDSRQTWGWYPPFALLADGRGLLVKRPRNRIQLWDAPTGRLVNEWSWRLEWVTCVAVSADGLTAVAGGRFGHLLFWDLE